jgi:hypothetical protein
VMLKMLVWPEGRGATVFINSRGAGLGPWHLVGLDVGESHKGPSGQTRRRAYARRLAVSHWAALCVSLSASWCWSDVTSSQALSRLLNSSLKSVSEPFIGADGTSHQSFRSTAVCCRRSFRISSLRDAIPSFLKTFRRW